MTDQYARSAKQYSRLDKADRTLCRHSNIDGLGPREYPRSMQVRDVITQKLSKAFAPLSLEVMDESHQHVGHAGHRPGGQTHFRVHIVAKAFEGKSRIDRHRMINEALAHELASGVHALAIHALAPDEEPPPFPPPQAGEG